MIISEREKPFTFVLCHGVFDLLHQGHIAHLEAASKLAERLMVSITADDFVKKRKTIESEQERATKLQALRCVSDVRIVRAHDVLDFLRRIQPDVYCKGIDYIGSLTPEEIAVCTSMKISIAFTTTEKHSTTNIIHRIKNA